MTTLFLVCALLSFDDEAAATAALDKFKTDYKQKDASARATAVQELGRCDHDKVYARLGQLLVLDEKEVRIAAAKALGGMTENRKKPVAYLIAATNPNMKEPLVLAAILTALGHLKEAPAASEVERHFKSKELAVCKAAVEAAAEIGSKSSVYPLIEAFKWYEATAQEAPNMQGGGGYGGKGGNFTGGGGGQVDQNAKAREAAMRPVASKALGTLTKASHGSPKEWDEWWKVEGARFMAGK